MLCSILLCYCALFFLVVLGNALLCPYLALLCFVAPRRRNMLSMFCLLYLLLLFVNFDTENTTTTTTTTTTAKHSLPYMSYY